MDYELLGMLSKINKSIKEQTEVLKTIAQELSKEDEIKLSGEELIKINECKKELGGKG